MPTPRIPDDPVAAFTGRLRPRVEAALEAALPPAKSSPAVLHAAMRHSVFAGGKRLRPLLLLGAAEACGGAAEAALPLAAAVEILHTFSLVHDDLPCMDDDDLRRGVPTCHVVYGEAVALLAGDALQALAFELVASHPGSARYPSGAMAATLARAAGSLHLVGGQVLDMEAEGRAKTSLAQLRAIHLGKTAALLQASLALGAMAADAPPRKLAALAGFGRDLGLAFQVVDDILDVTQSSGQLGKTAGKDAKAGKATYPAILGLPKARREAARLTDAALAALQPLGVRNSATLAALARRMLVRES
jgi:geranylgeranyl diphosphate synthase, type II